MFKIVYLYEFCLGIRNGSKKKKIPEVVGVMLEVFCFSDRRLFYF